jgi:Zn-dependent protease with chaperone function
VNDPAFPAGGGAASPWPGDLADGRSAELHDVALTVEGDALVGRDAGGAERVRWPIATIRSEPLDDNRVRLTSPSDPEAALTVGAEVAAARLAPPGGLARRPSRLRRVLLYGGGTIVAVALIYLNLDPLARAIARRVPQQYEAELGRSLEHFLAKSYCEGPEERAVLDRLAARLGGGAHELHVLDTEMVNAFTFPGGVVIVTRGLLAEAQGPDEVAGVLAHELSHVQARHVMIHFVRDSMLTALWQVSVGDYAGLFVVDPKTAFDIASLHFSRADEREADRGAVARLQAAGISRAGFRAFFERMQAKTDVVPAWLSNHPASAARIADIGQDVGAVAHTPALDAADWQTLKNACGGRQ